MRHKTAFVLMHKLREAMAVETREARLEDKIELDGAASEQPTESPRFHRRPIASFHATMSSTSPAAIRVVNQATSLNRASIMQGLFQSIEHKVSFGRPRAPPSDDAISKCVNDERDIQ